MAAAGIAHGDLQTDNLLVAPSGDLKFVDYDAFFVPEIAHLGAIEVGYPNFQHPLRAANMPFDSRLDRFSFLVIDSALAALASNPSLWEKVNADPQSLLIRASDFKAPHTSAAFHELAGDQSVGSLYRRIAAICEKPYDQVPTLADFHSGKGPAALNLRPLISNASTQNQNVNRSVAAATVRYQSKAGSVVDASNTSQARSAYGLYAELVGKVLSVQEGKTKYGAPRVFVLFGSSSGRAVYAPIWSDGLKNLKAAGVRLDSSLVGRWISIVGIMDAKYATKSWDRDGITVVDPAQLTLITEHEAKFRLKSAGVNTSSIPPSGGATKPTSSGAAQNRNAQIAATARAKAGQSPVVPQRKQPPQRVGSSNSRQSTSPPIRQSSGFARWWKGNWGWVVLGVVLVLLILG
jgi:hypothetical protein